MTDHESPNTEAAAYLARGTDPGDDDRPSIAELADYASIETLEREVAEARRKAIAEVVEALREPGANWMGPDCARTDGDDFADYIEQRFAWTPGQVIDEEAGW